MTAEQLEKGNALKKQIDELQDFAERVSKKGFDIQAWVPDSLKEDHEHILQVYTSDYVTSLNTRICHLQEQFNEL